MTEVKFNRLTTVPITDAWPMEAQDFTPWLANHIDQLGEAIGMELELTGTEMPVQSFFADILATDKLDGRNVLIENQYGTADHRHLGQILTYLAGLDAHTIIWIAERFQDAHLSAIRWLNNHTTDDFSFFAVKARVVRIGDSPFAPIFEVVEKPNDFERVIKQRTATSEVASYYDLKQSFWEALLVRYPDLAERGFKEWRYPNNYETVKAEPDIQVSVFIGKIDSGVYVRSAWGQEIEPILELLSPHSEFLEQKIGAEFGPNGRGDHILFQRFPKGHTNHEAWPEIMDWMYETLTKYKEAIQTCLKTEE